MDDLELKYRAALRSWRIRLSGNWEEGRWERGQKIFGQGGVEDLAVDSGEIHAIISGSGARAYQVNMSTDPLGHQDLGRIQREHQLPSLSEVEDNVELTSYAMLAVVETAEGPWAPALLPPAGLRWTCTCPDPASHCKHLAACLLAWVTELEARPDQLLRWIGPPGELARFQAPEPSAPEALSGAEGPIGIDDDLDEYWETPRTDWIGILGLGTEETPAQTSIPPTVRAWMDDCPVADRRLGPRSVREVLEELYEELLGI